MSPDEISAGARTVAHMSVFFEELKASALELAEQIPAQQRGYFRPEEEDRAHALLVSYWQARNALFELITSFRRDQEPDAPQHPAGFLVAFAAAVLLVDAARFLREHFHEHHVVRRKLNEPAIRIRHCRRHLRCRAALADQRLACLAPVLRHYLFR